MILQVFEIQKYAEAYGTKSIRDARLVKDVSISVWNNKHSTLIFEIPENLYKAQFCNGKLN